MVNQYNIYKIYSTVGIILLLIYFISPETNGPILDLVKSKLLLVFGVGFIIIGVISYRTRPRGSLFDKRYGRRRAIEKLDRLKSERVWNKSSTQYNIVVWVRKILSYDELCELYDRGIPENQLPRIYHDIHLDWRNWDLSIIYSPEDQQFIDKVKDGIESQIGSLKINYSASGGPATTTYYGKHDKKINRVYFSGSHRCLAIISENLTRDSRRDFLYRAFNRIKEDKKIIGEACYEYLIPIPLDDTAKKYMIGEEYLSGYPRKVINNEEQQIKHIVNEVRSALLRKVHIFIGYSHIDAGSLDKLLPYIKNLKAQDLIDYWYDKRIRVGEIFNAEISNRLRSSDLVILLISQNFLRSDNCIAEMNNAIRPNKDKPKRIVPIMLQRCDLRPTPLKPINQLLIDHKPIEEHENQKEAWSQVEKKLRDTIIDIGLQKASKEEIREYRF